MKRILLILLLSALSIPQTVPQVVFSGVSGSFTAGSGAVGSGEAWFGWTVSPSPGVTLTRIYYGTLAGAYSQHVDVPMPGNVGKVGGLVPKRTYYFAAVAFNGKEESAKTPELSVTK